MKEVALDVEGLTDVLTRIFTAAGGEGDEPAIIARNLVGANLAGHDSHGVVRTQRYCEWVRDGVCHWGRHLETVIDADAFALVDGQMGFGQSLGIETVALGLEKARESGVSIIALRNAGHLGRIGEWAERACAEGFVSIHFVNCYHSQLVAPFGGIGRAMGTNPVAIGMPVEGGDFILDFATSTVAEGKVLVAKKGGKPLPDGALVGSDGGLTTDPDVLYGPLAPGELPNPSKGPGAITAMGLHKGSGLSLACEMLAGALTGGGTCGPGYAFKNGMLSIYIDPERLDDGHGWAEAAKGYVSFVHSIKPRTPDSPVLVPGEPERARRRERTPTMPLPAEAWESILAAGANLGLDRSALAAVAER